MSKREFCYLYLTCTNTVEASEIAKALLEARLIACVKQLPVTSNYWSNNQIDQATEVFLIMESATDLFADVEKVATQIHSYETFVLEAVPITHISQKARTWLEKSIKS